MTPESNEHTRHKKKKKKKKKKRKAEVEVFWVRYGDSDMGSPMTRFEFFFQMFRNGFLT